MQFDSLTFVVFFALVLALYALLRGNAPKKNLLLVSSYLFYMAWSPVFVLLLMATTAVDWAIARRMDIEQRETVRRRWLMASLVSNLGVLGYFKYGGFLQENTRLLFEAAGIGWQPAQWDIVLPVGISFYTFQSLSYTIDVWRRRIPATRSLRDFALFVTFFPQLVAGPIVRASQFLPQLERERFIRRDRLARGLTLLVFGLFAKVVLADFLMAPVADRGFDTADAGTAATWLAVLAFSGQIFFDFSAYSSCAIGAAMCLGYSLPANFRAPYAAAGFSDFWRRWHISLSSWLRDYLYVALGGNRGTAARTRRNLMLTMLLGGLWHGAAWGFVIWGAMHGALLIAERMLRETGRVTSAFWRTTGGRLLTFALVTLAWIPFRAPSQEQLLPVLDRLAGNGGTESLATGDAIAVTGTLLLLLLWHRITCDRPSMHRFLALHAWLRAALVAAALLATLLLAKSDNNAFIYFQF